MGSFPPGFSIKNNFSLFLLICMYFIPNFFLLFFQIPNGLFLYFLWLQYIFFHHPNCLCSFLPNNTIMISDVQFWWALCWWTKLFFPQKSIKFIGFEGVPRQNGAPGKTCASPSHHLMDDWLFSNDYYFLFLLVYVIHLYFPM